MWVRITFTFPGLYDVSLYWRPAIIKCGPLQSDGRFSLRNLWFTGTVRGACFIMHCLFQYFSSYWILEKHLVWLFCYFKINPCVSADQTCDAILFMDIAIHICGFGSSPNQYEQNTRGLSKCNLRIVVDLT